MAFTKSSLSASSMSESAKADTTKSQTLENHRPPQGIEDHRTQPANDEKDTLTGTDTPTDDDARKITGFRWSLICAALYLSALMYGLDTTIAADVQGAVIRSFHEVEQLAWIGAGFPLGSVAVILSYGFLFTSFNMKWLYIVGIVLFQAGSALCGGAPSMQALIIGRVIAGAGGTGIYLGGLNYFSAMTTRHERAVYISGIGFVWGFGAILGPVVGGGFSDSAATWRWGFYINLIIGAVTGPIYLFYLPPVHPASGKPLGERLKSLDYAGFILSAGMWATFAIGFIFAGGLWPWSDGRAIAMVVVWGVLLGLYALQQGFCIFTTPETRSFPCHLLRSRTQVLFYVITTCANTCMFFTLFYIPIYFQFTRNDTSLMAAVRLLPYLVFTITVNLTTGWALPRVKYYMPMCLVSGILMTISSAMFVAYLSPSTPTPQIYGFSILMGVGTGITIQLGYSVSSLKVAPTDSLSAINLQNVAQIGATVLSIVLANQVFQSTAVRNLNRVLADQGFSQEDIHGIVAGAQSTLFGRLNSELRTGAIGAITSAMARAFIIPLVAGALGTIASLILKRERIFR
ncbi:MFS drug efflux transporter [Histoplasma capsulatum var. duboisii H88]|uniref:MFS drug efflux transporter n=2 Tax=Ajellomyces capsulatus (strain H88) TaxID=544711 RepID=F0UHJ5_AJEC8|nr:MFS drug efflux transporter [Histoplasma capsulatum var. duboisii H88]